MPINTKCPTCKRTLEIPDELMGKKVKCPACKLVFLATPGEAPPPAKAESSRTQPPKSKSEEGIRVRRRPAPTDEEEEEEEEEEDEEEEEIPRVRKKGVRRREEDEDEDEEEEDEEEERPRVRRKAVRRHDEEEDEDEEEEEEVRERRERRLRNPRQHARSIVLAPAISLMVVGGLSVLVSILATISSFTGNNPPEGGFVSIIVAITISQVCMGAAIFFGAFYMKNLTSYWYAMIASIAAMLPCTFCFVAGLPVGIWSLITINRSDVKPNFE